jgi:hypothetical protein
VDACVAWVAQSGTHLVIHSQLLILFVLEPLVMLLFNLSNLCLLLLHNLRQIYFQRIVGVVTHRTVGSHMEIGGALARH